MEKEFVDVGMGVNGGRKMCGGKEIEKKVVGEGFGDMVGERVGWGEKEEFCDGVG